MENIFFDSWESILRTFIITILAYFSLIFMIRVSGKRTLSKMNAFDFMVTIALGSTLAAVSLNKNIPLADGVIALGLLVFLQYMITWLSVRHNFVKNIITSTPCLILYKGQMIEDVMKKERITTEELRAKARQKGYGSIADIDAIVLETTGDINIIANIEADEVGTLELVKNFHKHRE